MNNETATQVAEIPHIQHLMIEGQSVTLCQHPIKTLRARSLWTLEYSSFSENVEKYGEPCEDCKAALERRALRPIRWAFADDIGAALFAWDGWTDGIVYSYGPQVFATEEVWDKALACEDVLELDMVDEALDRVEIDGMKLVDLAPLVLMMVPSGVQL